MSRRSFVAWLTFLGVVVAGTALWLVERPTADAPPIEGAWVLDRVVTPSVDLTLHGPADWRTGLGVGASRAFVDQGCGGFEFDVENSAHHLRFTLRQQDRSYGPCQSTDPTPGRWDDWMARVDHAERRGSTLLLTGRDVRLVWHREPPPPPDPDAVSLDGAWLLQTAVVAGRTVDLDQLHPAVLGVDSFGESIDTGCTQRSGDLETSSYHHRVRFVFTPTADRVCRSVLRHQERAVLQGLRGARRFTGTETTLELNGASTSLRFHRLPRLQIDQLDGTRWRLRALVEGSITVPPRHVRVIPAQPLVILSFADGFTKLNRGCRATAGGFGIDGAGRIQPLERRPHCHFSTALDGYLTRVYSRPWWFEIVGDRLRVQGYSGHGLIYRRMGS